MLFTITNRNKDFTITNSSSKKPYNRADDPIDSGPALSDVPLKDDLESLGTDEEEEEKEEKKSKKVNPKTQPAPRRISIRAEEPIIEPSMPVL